MTDIVKILLVAAEKRILEVYSVLLADLGYHVETAANPDEAMTLASDKRFDIVFIDQYLGPVQGINLMQEMQSKAPGLSFVIIMANPRTELAAEAIVEAINKGASDFISKPCSTADFLRSIDYVNRKKDLDRRHAEQRSRLEQRAKEKTAELNQVYISVLTALAMAVEKKELGTFGHSMRVSRYCRGIAAHLGLPEEQTNDLTTAALLHDIGMIGISDSILGKPGPLGRNEIKIVRSHPQNGVEILKPLEHFASVIPAILHHHERYDGSGYPVGLSGEQIPLLARIIAVADTYDMIMSDRPYRPAAFHEEALQELVFCSGTQFDPVIVRAFIAVMQDQKNTILVRDDGISAHCMASQAEGDLTADDTADKERSSP
jgi:putative two-component system response regulator